MVVIMALTQMSVPCGTADLVREPQVQSLMRGLLGGARAGFGHREEAAFIVRGASGNFYSIEWRSDGALDSARWEGPFRRGTVAIAHPHPTHLPMPSAIDINVARSAHVPVYVVTREKITRTDGGALLVVVEF